MTNASEKQNAPDRQRNGTFKKGHKKLGGRKRGTPNAISSDLKKLWIEVAAKHGSDGKGTGGLLGYFTFVALNYPVAYMRGLAKLRVLELREEQLRNKS